MSNQRNRKMSNMNAQQKKIEKSISFILVIAGIGYLVMFGLVGFLIWGLIIK